MIENLKEGSRGNLTSVTNIVQVIFFVIFVLSMSFGFLVNLSSYITKNEQFSQELLILYSNLR